MSKKDKVKLNDLLIKTAKCKSPDEGTFTFLNWMNWN
jgi:hypothetical protein